MGRPRLLDLFCGAGGCAVGYHRAGFDVVGVDHKPQPRYPFEFVQADALQYMEWLWEAEHAGVDDAVAAYNCAGGHLLRDFSVIHASPPCQAFTQMTNWDNRKKSSHPQLIAGTRELLQRAGLPWVIENVPGAPLSRPIMLCGTMFTGLRVKRHRYFECSHFLFAPHHDKRLCRSVKVAKASRKPRGDEWFSAVGCFGGKDAVQRAMGIDWMKTSGSRDTEIAQAIPPAFTEFVGRQLIEVV